MTAEGGGITPKDYSVEAQPASEDIANLEQMLEGMEFRAAPIELAALNRLVATARAKTKALEVRVAAAEAASQWLTEAHTRELEAAKMLCDIYFSIAEDCIPAEEIRRRRDAAVARTVRDL